MAVQILQGDCREVLASMPESSVHCCVTSPPYFGLRDYGNAAQIGLEQTPAEYVEQIVAVFREVRRVLRDDGTLWLNLGDSYAGSWGARGRGEGTNAARPDLESKHGTAAPGRHGFAPLGIKPKDLIGIPWRVAFALQQPWEKVNIKDRIDRAWLAALVDGEGCMTIMQAQNGEKSATSFPPVLQVKMCDPQCIERANQITGFEQCLRQDSPSRGGMRDTYQWRLTGRRAADIAAEIYPYLLIKRKQATILWNHQMVRDSYETKRGQPMPAAAREKQIVCRQLIQRLNQKQPVDLPSWMVEPSITVEPGWYLRQDVIWSKPNPMPESVTDRCTKAHEYVFLLSKSPRYFYDADAMREPAVAADIGAMDGGAQRLRDGSNANEGRNFRSARDSFKREDSKRAAAIPGQSVGTHRPDREESAYPLDTRNRRSVWSIATQPFKEAHFATMAPELAETCIKAGCPVGGVVLDPFGGAGTTGLVADRLQRDAVLVELNSDYIGIATRRIRDDAPLFAEVA